MLVCYPDTMPFAEGDTLLTVGEAAAALGLSRQGIYTAASRGFLKTVPIEGRLFFITAASVEEYRQAHLGKVGQPKKQPTDDGGVS